MPMSHPKTPRVVPRLRFSSTPELTALYCTRMSDSPAAEESPGLSTLNSRWPLDFGSACLLPHPRRHAFFGERVDALCNHEIQSIRRHDEVNLRLCEYEYCDCDMLTGAESPAVLKHSACGTRFSTFWCHDFRASSDFYQWHGDGTQLSNTWAVCRHQP